jgi:hypothetical protein
MSFRHLAFLGLAACGAGRHGSGPINIVDATVVVESCPDAHRMNARAADDAIRKLVEPCGTIPGGSAHFMAILVPGGRIELAAPDGDPAGGVVPTCVLEHQLLHHVLLQSACKFDVHLDQGKIALSRP